MHWVKNVKPYADIEYPLQRRKEVTLSYAASARNKYLSIYGLYHYTRISEMCWRIYLIFRELFNVFADAQKFLYKGVVDSSSAVVKIYVIYIWGVGIYWKREKNDVVFFSLQES